MARLKKGKGSRRGRHEWRSLLAKFDGSGLGVEGFCRREAISAASFYRWRSLLGNGGDGGGAGLASDAAPAFVDLGTLNSASLTHPRIDLKLDLGDGLVLRQIPLAPSIPTNSKLCSSRPNGTFPEERQWSFPQRSEAREALQGNRSLLTREYFCAHVVPKLCPLRAHNSA